jgi:hypothetical protein
MQKIVCLMVLAVPLLIAAEGSAADLESQSKRRTGGLTCYQWTIFPHERFKLDIRPHSPLSDREEEKKFDHPKQFAFSVHGKVVGDCGGDTVRPVVGTLISAVPVGQPFQARLGLENFNTTGGPDEQFCKDVEMSCKAADEPGFPPPVWNCFSQNKHPVEHPPSQLILVKESEDPRCSLFEDGQNDDISAVAEGAAPAGGLK